MAVTPASFRTAFPAFANTTTYPDPFVQFWLTQALGFLNEGRWSTLMDFGTMLWAAHWIALQAKDQRIAAIGGTPGAATGPIASKSADKVSISYDTKAASELDAGHWALTTYGLQYLRLARQIGAGPVQVDQQTSSVQYSGMAWSGPFPYGGG